MNDDSRDGNESRDSLPEVQEESVAQPSTAAQGPRAGKKKKGAKAKAKGAAAAPDASAPKSKVASETKRTKRKSAPPKTRKTPAPPLVEVVEAAPAAVLPPVAPILDTTPAPVTLRGAELALVEVRPDDISIPPNATDTLDEDDELFFADGEAASLRAADLVTPPPPSRVSFGVRPPQVQVHSAFEEYHPPPRSISPERQRKLTNYVKVAVGISVGLCVAALARAGLSTASEPVRSAAVSVAAPAEVVAPPPAPVPVPPSVPPPAPAPEAIAPAPPPVAAAPAAPPVAEPEAPVSTKSAKEERDDARRALERGKPKDAAAAAARSVAVDPTDGDAWLLLGAAEQELGHGAAAHAAFVSCVKQGKRGEIGECRAMLTWNGPR